DLLPQIDCPLAEATEQAVKWEWCLSVGQTESVNPMLILTAFAQFAGISLKFPEICRFQLCTKEKTEFF
ncbi:MAG: hypothetical protein ACI4TG_00575, partial [Ruminococcus sp.]